VTTRTESARNSGVDRRAEGGQAPERFLLAVRGGAFGRIRIDGGIGARHPRVVATKG